MPAEYSSRMHICMTRNDLLNDLRGQISPAERAALRGDTVRNISRYNRATLLRLLECGTPEPGRMDAGRVEALHAALREYLNRYMPDAPEAHKWIMLSCLFLAFVAMEPLHVDPELSDEMIDMYFVNYHHLDIIDTGYNDCYSEEYVTAAQAEADRIHMSLDYVEGGIGLLEKLVAGKWNEQFLVAEKGHLIRHGDFFE